MPKAIATEVHLISVVETDQPICVKLKIDAII
jgi:hypothetical protein